MERLQGFRFELRPNKEQGRKLRSIAGSCRYVYNRALELQKARYAANEKHLSYAELCRVLTAWRHDPETIWLAESPIHPLQQALKNLEQAYTNFFEDLKKAKRGEIRPEDVREPQKKKRYRHDSLRYPDPKQFKLDSANDRIFLPKLGWIRFRKSREVLGELRNITVTLSAGTWYASILSKREIEAPVHPSDSIVGIDMGVVRFATLSDETVFEPCASFKIHQQRLARYQRILSRKKKESKNRKKAGAKVSRIHVRIANVRKDYLHKTSTTISKNHAVVCIEDLRVKNMSASAKGTVENPGKNVRQKTGLNRSILDQGWAAFRTMLEYKQQWSGGYVVAVPPQNTSRTCIVCLHVSSDNRKTQAKFECLECGYAKNADVVGAINILRAGHARLAFGDTSLVGASAKEPAKKLCYVA
jgi:putative transposase